MLTFHALRAALVVGIALAGGGKGAAVPPSKVTLPERTLICRLGHVINFDPTKLQSMADLRYDSAHDFALHLPAIPARTAPPPEPWQKPEKVNRRTRILRDPDGIAPQPRHRFHMVVDYWPDRVELSSMIADPLRSVIVIDQIDRDAGTTNIVIMRATELTHFDPDHLYQGQCRFGPIEPHAAGA